VDNPAINIISVCSGIGGLDKGAGAALRTLGFTPRTICYVEREAFACAVLAARMETGDLDTAPVWTDLESFPGQIFADYCEMVIAGLPCQPYSVAGKQLGEADERYLWPAFFRLLQSVRPALVFLENVPNMLRFFEPIAEDLCAMGYGIEAGIFSAAEVGAPHRRERLFVLAHAIGQRWGRRSYGDASGNQREIQASGSCGSMGDTGGAGLQGGELGKTCDSDRNRPEAHGSITESGEALLPVWPLCPSDYGAWERVMIMRPDLMPTINGKLNPYFVEWLMGFRIGWTDLPDEPAHRTDRLRALGNAVVPATAELALTTLFETATHNGRIKTYNNTLKE